ncbi:MAG: radical SAM protein [Pseudomonadota bacterium]
MNLLYCDKKGQVLEDPRYRPSFRQGRQFCSLSKKDLIKLPYGSILFSMPERYPVTGKFAPLKNENLWAASAFLSSGYLRTYLPGYLAAPHAPILPLWAYCGVAMIDGEFYVPAIRIDKDERSDPAIHENDPQLHREIKKHLRLYPHNRLVGQLAFCATQYRCLCARNFFLGRYEAPIPTSRPCNARCLGCLSKQKVGSRFESSQDRLPFHPTPEEISEVILHHFSRVKKAVSSFGQGCEGEPLMRGKDLAKAIALVRQQTDQGTINLNTNGSRPEMLKLMIDQGLNSVRISFNSFTKKYFNGYFRPQGYEQKDVLKSVAMALDKGLFVSLNLFFLPGFTDSQEETDSLCRFLEKYPVSMIQTRNLNIDPDFYLEQIDFKDSTPMGVANLLNRLKKDFSPIKLGYYNPSIN